MLGYLSERGDAIGIHVLLYWMFLDEGGSMFKGPGCLLDDGGSRVKGPGPFLDHGGSRVNDPAASFAADEFLFVSSLLVMLSFFA